MAAPQLIGPVPGTTPAEFGRTRARSRPLPYDLLKEASRRLEIMSLLAATVWVLGTVLFGSMGVVMLLNRSYSFGVWFSLIAALYCAGWIRTVRSERPKT